MKKSQVLAALALAFALGLGVVAPVANTYAQITPNDATQEQKDAIYEQAREALNAALAIENISNYENLYVAFDAEGALIDDFADANKDIVRAFNKAYTTASAGNMQGNSGINGDASNVNGYLNANQLYKQTNGKYDWIKADKEFAPLKSINRVTSVSTVKEAYDMIVAIRDAAADNISTLENNYKAGSGDASNPNIIDTVTGFYTSIRQKANGWLSYLNTTYGTVLGSADPVALAANLEAINESAYDSMVDGDAWNETYGTGNTNIQKAARLGLLINETKNLPKYGNVKDVVDGINNVRAVLSPENGVATTNVSYANAQQYVAALNSAVAAFKNGTVTPAPTETRTFTSADGNVTVSGKLPAGLVVKVAAKTEDKVAAFGDKAYKMWDISLANADGTAYNLDGKTTITVSIKVPAGINGEKAGIYFVDAKGNVQNYKATYANNTLTFTTNHLSLWAIVEDNGKVITTPEAPTTGIVSNEGNASTTVAMVAGLATALTAAGAGVVAYRNARRSTRK